MGNLKKHIIYIINVHDCFKLLCPFSSHPSSLQATALPMSGDIGDGKVWYLKGALRIQTAIAAVLACAQLGIEDWLPKSKNLPFHAFKMQI